ncbi:MAG: DMT family transporter [Pseudomonadota bacterium]
MLGQVRPRHSKDPPLSTPFRENLKGALFMSLAMAGYVLNDAAMKQVLVQQPLFPSIFIRGMAATVLLGLLCAFTGAFRWRWTGRDRKLIGWRVVAEAVTTLLFLSALARLPIANVTAILLAAPLAVTLAASVFLNAPIGWRRVVALLVGFAGVMMIVRPGAASFSPWSLLALAAVGGVVLRDLATRQLSASVPSTLVACATSAVITAIGAVGTLVAPLPVFTPVQVMQLVGASGLLVVGYVFSVRTMRVGDIAFVSGFRYTTLLWALLVGILLFGEVPDVLTMLGAVLIVGSGVFSVWREHVVATSDRRQTNA